MSAHSETGELPREKLELSPAALFYRGLASRDLQWVWDLPGCMSSQDSYSFAIPPLGWQLSHKPLHTPDGKGLEGKAHRRGRRSLALNVLAGQRGGC